MLTIFLTIIGIVIWCFIGLLLVGLFVKYEGPHSPAHELACLMVILWPLFLAIGVFVLLSSLNLNETIVNLSKKIIK